MNATICMAPSGVEFDLLRPDPATVHIEDIAHHLSRICRFTGGTSMHYSVAQHSVHVAERLPEKWRLIGLLHDAAEAYVGDVSRPLKMLIRNAYGPIERRVLEAIFTRYDLPKIYAKALPGIVKEADRVMCELEQRDLMPDAPWWQKPRHEGVPPIEPLDAATARDIFVGAFRDYAQRSA